MDTSRFLTRFPDEDLAIINEPESATKSGQKMETVDIHIKNEVFMDKNALGEAPDLIEAIAKKIDETIVEVTSLLCSP